MIDDEDDDDSPFDRNGILKDGRSIRVSFFDAMRARQPEDHEVIVNRGFAMQDSRPGGPWTAPDRRGAVELGDARQRLEDAYRAYDEADANAWRNPPSGPCLQSDASGEFGRDIPEGAYPLSAGEGTRCTINGQDGRLARKGNWLVCEPVRGMPCRRGTRAPRPIGFTTRKWPTRGKIRDERARKENHGLASRWGYHVH
jgi:hypothetical protein